MSRAGRWLRTSALPQASVLPRMRTARPRHWPALLRLVALVATSACATPLAIPLPVPVPPARGEEAIGEYAAVAEHVLAESNRARVEAGLPRMLGHAELHLAAQEYAEELAARGVLDHTSPTEGRRTMVERIEAAGARHLLAGENLAKITVHSQQIAVDAVYLWLESEGHRRNMLTRSFTHSGVGVARDRRGDWYVVQLYMHPERGRF